MELMGLRCRYVNFAALITIAYLKSHKFASLSDEDQALVFFVIGQLACAGAETLSFSHISSDEKLCQNTCSVCDITMGYSRVGIFGDDSETDAIFILFINLLKLTQKQKLRRPRIAAMIAFRRLLLHSKGPNNLNLADSPIGPWCMQALQSSMRDLRIAAG